MRRRPVRVAVAGLVALCLAACTPEAHVSYRPPIVPFTLTVGVDRQGHVSVSASVDASVVTPIGTFGVGGGASGDIARQNPGTVVVFRSGTADTDFLIHTDRVLTLTVDGHVVEEISQNLVVITVSAGTSYTVSVREAHPDPTPPAPTPDANCKGITHRVILPELSLGPLGKDTLDTVRAKLTKICLNVVVDVVQDPNCTYGDQGRYKCPPGLVDHIHIPCDRHLWMRFWHNYDYLDVYFADMYYISSRVEFSETDWGWCSRPGDSPDLTPGETDTPGTLAVVRSDRPTVVSILSA